MNLKLNYCIMNSLYVYIKLIVLYKVITYFNGFCFE